MKQTYSQKNIFQNFITNKNIKEENNNEIPKSINILSNISKNTNNNNIGETEEFINIIPNKQEQNPLQENIENKMEKNNNNMGKNNQNYFEEEEEEEGENDIEKEMDEENGFSFTKQKNCQNIIKHSNDMVIQHDELGNEFGDYMNKNIYPGFQINNSLSNLDITALNGNNMSKEDRNMSGIPLRKDVDMEHNNNNEFNI